MEASEMPGRKDADQECTQHGGSNIRRGFEIEIADSKYEPITDDDIEDAPTDVDCGGRESLTWGLGKGGLEWAPRGAADKVRDGVRKEGAAEEIGENVKPVHVRMLLVSRRLGVQETRELLRAVAAPGW